MNGPSPRLTAFGRALLAGLERIRQWLEPLTKHVFGPVAPSAPAGSIGYDAEPEALLARSRTQRAQVIVRAAVCVVAVLLVWAALARIDEVTRGDGKVIPSRQLQVIQSLDGGVV